MVIAVRPASSSPFKEEAYAGRHPWMLQFLHGGAPAVGEESQENLSPSHLRLLCESFLSIRLYRFVS